MTESDVQLRRVPYPYRAILAICSDLDETPDAAIYMEIMRFLNTSGTTRLGAGLGLEVGNTIYFDMPPGQFAYWNTDDAGRQMIRELIRSGHVDCLHSYGDLAMTRGHAGKALDELAAHDCRLEVWIDHGTAVTNFGADIMRGQGDVTGSPAYHADLTIGHGIRYVWRGRITSVIGQDVAMSLGGLWRPDHPLASARTVGKEAAKQVLARLHNTKYALHAGNRVLRASTLRDGRPVYEFLRSSPHWGGISSCDTGRGIGQVLTDAWLNRLVRREGVCILYTHLGKIWSADAPFDTPAIDGLQRVANASRDGRLLVRTTRRVLRYIATRDALTWTANRKGNVVDIDLRISEGAETVARPVAREHLAGLTFYIPDDLQCRLRWNARELNGLRLNPKDHTGRVSVTIPMSSLSFPDV